MCLQIFFSLPLILRHDENDSNFLSYTARDKTSATYVRKVKFHEDELSTKAQRRRKEILKSEKTKPGPKKKKARSSGRRGEKSLTARIIAVVEASSSDCDWKCEASTERNVSKIPRKRGSNLTIIASRSETQFEPLERMKIPQRQ